MATKEKTVRKSSAKKSLSKDQLISAFMTKVLEEETIPGSVFKFCKELNIEEKMFYQHFGGFDALQKHVWVNFFDQTMKVIAKASEYQSFGKREKLLTFYFTFFEMLTVNRSYILFTLKGPQELAQLTLLRKHFHDYIRSIIELSIEGETFKKYSTKAIEELAWAQLLVILRFWIKDDSPGFEKTDVMIEKTINTTFDVVDHTPIQSVVDYVKFLIKETVGS